MARKKNDAVGTEKMNLFDALFMGIGTVVGGSLFGMAGVGIALAGPGVPITFLIAGVCAMIQNLPMMALGSALPVNGGDYKYVSRFMGPVCGFAFQWMRLLNLLNVSVSCLAAGRYLPSILPFLSPEAAGILTLAVVYVPCLFNVRISSAVQNIMVAMLLLALCLFIGSGWAPAAASFSWRGMVTTTGVVPILVAVSFLRTSLFGATGLVNMGGEIRNPRKTIPVAIAGATGICTVLFALVGFVASHAVPWQMMDGQPLSVAAETFMSGSMFAFFVIFGALFALTSTMLAAFLGNSRLIHAGAADRIWPSFFIRTNRYGVPARIMTLMFLVGIVPVLLRLELKFVFAAMNAPSLLFGLLPQWTLVIAPEKLPQRFQRASFRLSKGVSRFVVLLHTCITFFLAYHLFAELTLPVILGIAGFFLLGLAYYFLRVRHLLEKEGYDLPAAMTAYDPDWLGDSGQAGHRRRPEIPRRSP